MSGQHLPGESRVVQTHAGASGLQNSSTSGSGSPPPQVSSQSTLDANLLSLPPLPPQVNSSHLPDLGLKLHRGIAALHKPTWNSI